jgi:hypothetical protein
MRESWLRALSYRVAIRQPFFDFDERTARPNFRLDRDMGCMAAAYVRLLAISASSPAAADMAPRGLEGSV